MAGEFLKISALQITEVDIDFEAIIEASRQNGTAALSQWFEIVKKHIDVVLPALSRSRGMFDVLVSKCKNESSCQFPA